MMATGYNSQTRNIGSDRHTLTMNSGIAKGLIAAIPFLMTGCASYYTHYAVFPAENSAGEQRQFKLTWQTADYPDWWFQADQSTPITLETQCSERKWRLVDRTHDAAGSQTCDSGIRACGSEQQDRLTEVANGSFSEVACMSVNPSDSDALVTDIASALEIQVNCAPRQTSRTVGGEVENIDYLRASPVPYTVYSRKGVRGRLDSRPPELDDSVCDDE